MAAGFFAKLWDKFKKIRSGQKPPRILEGQDMLEKYRYRNQMLTGVPIVVKDMVKRLDKERLEKEANGKIGLANPNFNLNKHIGLANPSA